MTKVTITFTVERGYVETLWDIIRRVLNLSPATNFHMEWKDES